MPENPTYAETIELSNKEPKTFFTEELQLSIRGQWDVRLCSLLEARFRLGCVMLSPEGVENSPKGGPQLWECWSAGFSAFL